VSGGSSRAAHILVAGKQTRSTKIAPGTTQITPGFASLRPSTFVGREHELSVLHACIDDAVEGRNGFVLLAGAPGIGKTRIAEELAAVARRRGMLVLWGRCWEAAGAPAFWPWMQIIRAAIRDLEPAHLRVLLGHAAADVASIVPDVRRVLPDLPTPSGLDTEHARQRAFDGVIGVVRGLAAQVPLVLLLDDLHGADRSSLLLLHSLAHALQEAPAHILLVATCRDAALDSQPLLADALDAFRDDRCIRLAGLDAVEIERLVEAKTGFRPPAPLVARLLAATEGNPLFLKEFAEHLPLGSAMGADTPVPESVRAMIRHRLNTLPDAARRLLSIAAVIGREFAVDLLKAAAGEWIAEGHDPDGALSAATGSGIVMQANESEPAYRFGHALICETLYADLPVGRRERLHRSIGDALEQRPDRDVRLAELVHHFYEAGAAVSGMKVAAYAEQAARRALDSLAYEEAARLSDLGLAALHRAHIDAPQEQAELLLLAGRARFLTGERDAKGLLDTAVDLARHVHIPELFARAALDSGAGDSSANANPEYAALLDEVLTVLPSEDSSLRIRVQSILSNLLLRVPNAREKQRAVRLLRDALARARRLGVPECLHQTLHNWYYVDYHPDGLAEREAATNELVLLGERMRDPSAMLVGLQLRIATAYETGDQLRATCDVAAYARLAEDLRQPEWLWRIPLYRGAHALLTGAFDEAEECADAMRVFGETTATPEAKQIYQVLLLMLRMFQGRLEEVAALESTPGDIVEQHSWNSAWHASRAFGAAELGLPDVCRYFFEELADHDFEKVPRDVNYLVAMSYLARACAFLEDQARAQIMYRDLLPYRSRIIVNPTVLPCEGPAARYLGVLAATLQRWDEAAGHFEAALELCGRLGWRPFEAYTCYDYAHALVRGGESTHAAELARAALDVASELGMRTVATRAQTLLAELQPATSPERPVTVLRGTRDVPQRDRPAASEVRPLPSTRVFVGRGHELATLRSSVEGVLEGRGQLLLLAGEPGIGKTRTAEELVSYAQHRGVKALWGRCYESEGAPPFWPWVQVIRAGLKGLSLEERRDAFSTGAAEIAPLVPEIRSMLPELPMSGVPESPEGRFLLFDAVAGFIERLAHATPLVIVIDDLHGADSSSMSLLQFLTRHIRDSRVVFLATYRNVGLPAGHPLNATLMEALRVPSTERLELRGLTEPEVSQFVEATVGARPTGELVAALHRLTEGNPLFLREFVRALADEGRLNDSAISQVALPESVAAVIDRRLSPLSAPCRQMLCVAAVVGREFASDVLSQAWDGSSAGSGSAGAAVADLLAAAEVLGIVASIPESPRRYRFAHALIRETLYGALMPTDRARMHRQVGEALELLPDSEQYLAELAYHFFAAGRSAGNEKAIRYAQRAGERALALTAYEEAARLFQLGLEAVALSAPPSGLGVTDAADATGDKHDARRCELLLGLGRARQCAGESEAAIACSLQAVDLARRLGAVEQFARAAICCKPRDASGDADAQFVALLEEARLALGDTESALLVRVIGCLANELARVPGERRRGAMLSREAVSMARRVGDPAALVEALRHWYEADCHPDNLEERLATAHELGHLAERLHDRIISLEGLRIRVAAELERAHLAAVEKSIAEFAQTALALRQPLWLAWVPVFRCTLATMRGEFADAERLAAEGLAVGQQAQQPDAVPNYLIQLFTWRALHGTLTAEEIDAGMAQYGGSRSWNVGWQAGAAWGYMELGRESEARAIYDKLAADDFGQIPRDGSWLVTLAFCSQLCVRFNDRARAAALYTALLPYRTRAVTNPSATQCAGSVELYLGMLVRTLGRHDEAARHFDEAMRHNTTIGAHAYAAQTQYEHAVLLADRGDCARALELAAAARASAERMPMTALATKANALQMRCRAGASPSRVVLGGTPDTVGFESAPWTNEFEYTPCRFRKHGDVWEIAYAGTATRLMDSRGLQYLAQLLRHPGRQFHVLDLVPAPPSANQKPGNRNQEPAIANEALPTLDAQAKAEYRRRLLELRAELAEAEDNNDRGSSEQARAEIEILSEHLASAVGLGGRDRPVGAAVERARVAVTKRIKAALRKIQTAHPPLAAHLKGSITTGYFCAYTPIGSAPSWEL
jgi:predicted ATPase